MLEPGLLESLAGDASLESSLAHADLYEWLSGLQQREREVLALRFGADLRAAEIAGLLDLTEANVHQIVSRALRRLRARAKGEISTQS